MASVTSMVCGVVSDEFCISPPQKSFTIAIIGGGLAGLTLGIGLFNQDVPFHIYESAPAFAEIGAGVRCHPNAIKVLGLIDPKILAGYWKWATFDSSFERGPGNGLSFRWGQDWRRNNGMEGRAGDLIWEVNWKGKENGHEDGKTSSTSAVHRARFLDEMIKLLPEGSATFGKRLKDVMEFEHGVSFGTHCWESNSVSRISKESAIFDPQLKSTRVQGNPGLTFADGSSAEHSAVIGCDGIKSRTRQIMYPEVFPQFTGHYCYRGLVPMGVANETLGADLAGNGQLYCGYGGYILTYPVNQGKLMNIVAVRRTEAKDWGLEQWIMPSSKGDMQRDFDGWEAKLVDLMSRLENYDRWPLFDVPLDESYAKGRMCLVGDAAHASTPHIGSGAGMAFEDAYIMSNILGALRDVKDIPMAFEAFDSARRKRALRLLSTSRAAGLANVLAKEGVTDDLPELRKDIDLRYVWIWDEDLEMALREALTKLNLPSTVSS